jgi:RecA-family ATPase
MAMDFYTTETVLNIPPQEYLIDKILPEGLNLLSAHPKAGKSLVALDWGLCLSSGLDWMGIKCAQCAVLYVLSEARGTLPSRVRAWQKMHGKRSAELTFACGFTNLQDYAKVTTDLAPHVPEDGLIIWDTLSRNIEGEEGESRTMGAVIRSCDAIYESKHTSSLLVHHSTKEHTINTGGATVTASWYRGHSSLLGAIDMGMTLVDDELVCKAARHDEPFDNIPLQRTSVEGGLVLNWHSKKVSYR